MKRPKIYAAIAFSDDSDGLTPQEVIEQGMLAIEHGADGVFLIGQNGNPATAQVLGSLCLNLKTEHRLPCVGLNLLNTPIGDATMLALASRADMLWVDNCGVSSAGLTTKGEQLSAFARRTPQVQVFASVAFKGQPEEPLPSAAAVFARHAGFIPTTSGPATGVAPDLSQVRDMFRSAGDMLALAYAMTPETVKLYAPYVSHILVASGIGLEGNFHRIDPVKLGELIANAEY